MFTSQITSEKSPRASSARASAALEAASQRMCPFELTIRAIMRRKDSSSSTMRTWSLRAGSVTGAEASRPE